MACFFSAHLRQPLRAGRPRCATRFPCAADGELGCNKTFADKKGRLRHREQACQFSQLPALTPAFRCCCKKSVKRWYRFRDHHKICAAAAAAEPPHKGDNYLCQCKASFPSFASLQDHYTSKHTKPVGRPRKPDPACDGCGEVAGV